MSEPKRDDEPTMEEILASIRKIISEDDPEETAAAANDANDARDDDEPEPMELTQMVSEDGSVVDLRAEQRATLVPFHEEPADEPADAVEDEESEAPTDEPLVPVGTRVHAELVDDDLEAEEPEPVTAEAEPECFDAEPQVVEDAPEPEESPEPEAPAMEGLVSAEVAAAATAAMSRLKDSLAVETAAGVGGGKTLEALVCEAMAPHLKAWLDQNLAGLVERVVREEIQKLVKRS